MRNNNIMLTPNLQKNNLADRRRRMAVIGGVNVSKNLITLKHATIYEVSAIDKS